MAMSRSKKSRSSKKARKPVSTPCQNRSMKSMRKSACFKKLSSKGKHSKNKKALCHLLAKYQCLHKIIKSPHNVRLSSPRKRVSAPRKKKKAKASRGKSRGKR